MPVIHLISYNWQPLNCEYKRIKNASYGLNLKHAQQGFLADLQPLKGLLVLHYSFADGLQVAKL